MKDAQLEALLLGARPYTPGRHTDLTQTIMGQIKGHERFARQVYLGKQPKRSLLTRLRALHGAGLAVAILVTVGLLTGVAYASVRFVPDLIQILDKKLNSAGRVEYSVPAFANCYTLGQPELDTFEVAPTAGLSDEEVEKTLRAKCELMGMDKFAKDTWPTYGEHKEWKSGDSIFYTRPDRLGKVKEITAHSVTLEYGSGEQPTVYKTFQRAQLEVYSRGERMPLKTVKPGDVVFGMVRVSETYAKPGDNQLWEHGGIQFAQRADPQPKVLGIVGVVKMSLPEKYYREMQDHIHEVRPCEGNPSERCSNGPGGVGLDIFPLDGGADARNPHAPKWGTADNWEGRGISGTISTIEDGQFTITSSSGKQYRVHAPRSIVDTYNETQAPRHVPYLTTDVRKVQVHVGSWVSLLYHQKPGADPRNIQLGDITLLMLLTDLSPKGGKL